VSVGRLIPCKGFDTLIRACARLQRGGMTLQCEIIGDGPQRSALEALIAEEKLGGSVTLAGVLPQEAVAERLRMATVFALAARVDEAGVSDVLPTVIIEAMGAGLPVVATRVGGIPELVVPHETGLLVEPEDPERLAEALEKILLSPPLRHAMAEASRARAQRFAMETTSLQIKARIEQGCGSSGLPTSAHQANQANHRPSMALRWLCNAPDGTERTHRFLRNSEPLRRAFPEARLLCLAPAPAALKQFPKTWPEGWRQALQEADSLPDPIVVESFWVARHASTHTLQQAWMKIARGIPNESLLEQARRAFYLQQSGASFGHLHAFGDDALLCAVLLKMLGCVASGVSVTLEEEPGFSKQARLLLLQHCAGGWVASEALRSKAGERFQPLPRRGLIRWGFGWRKRGIDQTAAQLQHWMKSPSSHENP
jgi:hypothetical protein